MFSFAITPDPNSVVAGWIPLVLIAVLALAVVLLYRSLRKQMRKIDIPEEGIPTRGAHPRRGRDQADHGSDRGRTDERTHD